MTVTSLDALLEQMEITAKTARVRAVPRVAFVSVR